MIVTVGVPVVRARAVAVVQAGETVPAALELDMVVLTAPLTALPAPVIDVAAALIVGAALVAAPAIVVAAAAIVGPLVTADPATEVIAALTVGASRVAEPVMLVAPLATVAFIAELPHAAKSGRNRSTMVPHHTRGRAIFPIVM